MVSISETTPQYRYSIKYKFLICMCVCSFVRESSPLLAVIELKLMAVVCRRMSTAAAGICRKVGASVLSHGAIIIEPPELWLNGSENRAQTNQPANFITHTPHTHTHTPHTNMRRVSRKVWHESFFLVVVGLCVGCCGSMLLH